MKPSLLCANCGEPFTNVHYYKRRTGPRAGQVVRYVRQSQRYCSPACGGSHSVRTAA